jgi:hypothetical protein
MAEAAAPEPTRRRVRSPTPQASRRDDQGVVTGSESRRRDDKPIPGLLGAQTVGLGAPHLGRVRRARWPPFGPVSAVHERGSGMLRDADSWTHSIPEADPDAVGKAWGSPARSLAGSTRRADRPGPRRPLSARRARRAPGSGGARPGCRVCESRAAGSRRSISGPRATARPRPAARGRPARGRSPSR